jgi:phage-related protein
MWLHWLRATDYVKRAGAHRFSLDIIAFLRYCRWIVQWTVQTLNRVVDAEIEALPIDMRARLARLSTLIEQVGFEALPANTVKHLDEKLWELRISGRDGISRAIYLTAFGRRMIILRVFVKKTRKTPPHELARQRAKEVR